MKRKEKKRKMRVSNGEEEIIFFKKLKKLIENFCKYYVEKLNNNK